MKKIFVFFLTLIVIFLLNTSLAKADCECPNGTVLKSGAVSAEECKTLQENCTISSSATVSLANPLGQGKTDIPTLLGKIINSVLGIIGSLALIMFIYGGASWMLSGGNQEQVTKGKNIIIWATIGMVIIFTAYALVKFVLTTVTGA
ncbi:MAG: pilin [bacterium]